MPRSVAASIIAIGGLPQVVLVHPAKAFVLGFRQDEHDRHLVSTKAEI
jgi:hypothetical protein